MGDINVVMAFMLLMVATGAVFVRENSSALDSLADWAASRSYGLKCAKAELDRRKEIA